MNKLTKINVLYVTWAFDLIVLYGFNFLAGQVEIL